MRLRIPLANSCGSGWLNAKANSRLLWTLTDREPRCGHETFEEDEDDDNGKCRCHDDPVMLP